MSLANKATAKKKKKKKERNTESDQKEVYMI